MKNLLLCLSLLNAPSILVPGRASPGDPLRVVATLPDLGDLAREIGGERVQVQTLYKGLENTHAFTAKPSHLIAVSRADLFLQVGLSLESGFLPGLLEQARNENLRPGGKGLITVSAGWEALDVPQDLSRKAGDVHPHGNPHMNLDPRAGEFMAARILEGLTAADPEGAPSYRARHGDLQRRLEAARARWNATATRWKGRHVVVYHQEYDYLCALYGLVIDGKVEPKPGIPPTPNHVASLIEGMKRQNAAAILTAVWSNNETVKRIAEKTGARVVELPNMCAGIAGTETWIEMMDLIHRRLDEALASP